MADTAELEKIQQTLDYFNKYYQFDSAIKVVKENKKYLETYILTKNSVESKFDAAGKKKKAMLIALIAAAIGALIVLLVTGFNFTGVNIGIAAAAAVILGGGVFFGLNFYITSQVNKKWAEQQQVNEGIRAQISDADRRCENLEKQKSGYLSGLEEKGLVVIPTKYLIEAEKIASYVKEGKAETAQQAVEMYEQEQVRLKEKAIAERKRRDEEVKQRALKLEQQRMERQKELERQQALEEQMRLSALEKEKAEEAQAAQAAQAAQEAKERKEEKPKARGLSLSMGRADKKSSATSAPSAPLVMNIPEKREEPAAPVMEKAPEPAAPVAEIEPEPVAPVVETAPEPIAPVVETVPEPVAPVAETAPEPVAPVVEKAPEPIAPTVQEEPQETEHRPFGLSMRGSDSAKKHSAARPTPKNARVPPVRKPAKNEPIKLVDEPDDTSPEDEQEALDLQSRMKDLLSPSHNTSPLFRNSAHKDQAPTRGVPSAPQQLDDFDELAFLKEPTKPSEPTVQAAEPVAAAEEKPEEKPKGPTGWAMASKKK